MSQFKKQLIYSENSVKWQNQLNDRVTPETFESSELDRNCNKFCHAIGKKVKNRNRTENIGMHLKQVEGGKVWKTWQMFDCDGWMLGFGPGSACVHKVNVNIYLCLRDVFVAPTRAVGGTCCFKRRISCTNRVGAKSPSCRPSSVSTCCSMNSSF